MKECIKLHHNHTQNVRRWKKSCCWLLVWCYQTHWTSAVQFFLILTWHWVSQDQFYQHVRVYTSRASEPVTMLSLFVVKDHFITRCLIFLWISAFWIVFDWTEGHMTNSYLQCDPANKLKFNECLLFGRDLTLDLWSGKSWWTSCLCFSEYLYIWRKKRKLVWRCCLFLIDQFLDQKK